MKIQNTKIQNVTMGLDADDMFYASISFKGLDTTNSFIFYFENLDDVYSFKKLMQYTGVRNPKHMNGRIIRIITFEESFHGFGHPIEDKFVPTSSSSFQEITAAQFERLLPTIH